MFSIATKAKQEIEDTIFSAIDRNDVLHVKKQLDKNIDLKITSSPTSCETAFEAAVNTGNVKLVRMIYEGLIEQNKSLIDVKPDEYCNSIGESALISAVLKDDNEITNYLSEQGIKSYSALKFAIANGSLELVKIIIDNNEEFYLNNNSSRGSGKTALSLAVSIGEIEIVEFLLENEMKVHPDDIFVPSFDDNHKLLYMLVENADKVPAQVVFTQADKWNSQPELAHIAAGKIVFNNLKEREAATELIIKNDYHNLIQMVVDNEDYDINPNLRKKRMSERYENLNKNILERSLSASAVNTTRVLLKSPQKIKIHWQDFDVSAGIAKSEAELLDNLKLYNRLPDKQTMSIISISAVAGKNWPVVTWIIDNYTEPDVVDLVFLVASKDFKLLPDREEILNQALTNGYNINVKARERFRYISVMDAAISLGYETSFIQYLLRKGFMPTDKNISYYKIYRNFESKVPSKHLLKIEDPYERRKEEQKYFQRLLAYLSSQTNKILLVINHNVKRMQGVSKEDNVSSSSTSNRVSSILDFDIGNTIARYQYTTSLAESKSRNIECNVPAQHGTWKMNVKSVYIYWVWNEKNAATTCGKTLLHIQSLKASVVDALLNTSSNKKQYDIEREAALGILLYSSRLENPYLARVLLKHNVNFLRRDKKYYERIYPDDNEVEEPYTKVLLSVEKLHKHVENREKENRKKIKKEEKVIQPGIGWTPVENLIKLKRIGVLREILCSGIDVNSEHYKAATSRVSPVQDPLVLKVLANPDCNNRPL